MIEVCFHCNEPLTDDAGHRVPRKKRIYHGTPVLIHTTCATEFDREQEEEHVTAQPAQKGRYHE